MYWLIIWFLLNVIFAFRYCFLWFRKGFFLCCFGNKISLLDNQNIFYNGMNINVTKLCEHKSLVWLVNFYHFKRIRIQFNLSSNVSPTKKSFLVRKQIDSRLDVIIKVLWWFWLACLWIFIFIQIRNGYPYNIFKSQCIKAKFIFAF